MEEDVTGFIGSKRKNGNSSRRYFIFSPIVVNVDSFVFPPPFTFRTPPASVPVPPFLIVSGTKPLEHPSHDLPIPKRLRATKKLGNPI